MRRQRAQQSAVNVLQAHKSAKFGSWDFWSGNAPSFVTCRTHQVGIASWLVLPAQTIASHVPVEPLASRIQSLYYLGGGFNNFLLLPWGNDPIWRAYFSVGWRETTTGPVFSRQRMVGSSWLPAPLAAPCRYSGNDTAVGSLAQCQECPGGRDPNLTSFRRIPWRNKVTTLVVILIEFLLNTNLQHKSLVKSIFFPISTSIPWYSRNLEW